MDEITELRRWAAEVCGLTIKGEADSAPLVRRLNEDGYLREYERWLPDQDIAQALEVWYAVEARYPKLTLQIYSPGATKLMGHKAAAWLAIIDEDPWGNDGAGGASRYNASLSHGLTEACYAAWSAMQGQSPVREQ